MPPGPIIVESLEVGLRVKPAKKDRARNGPMGWLAVERSKMCSSMHMLSSIYLHRS